MSAFKIKERCPACGKTFVNLSNHLVCRPRSSGRYSSKPSTVIMEVCPCCNRSFVNLANHKICRGNASHYQYESPQIINNPFPRKSEYTQRTTQTSHYTTPSTPQQSHYTPPSTPPQSQYTPTRTPQQSHYTPTRTPQQSHYTPTHTPQQSQYTHTRTPSKSQYTYTRTPPKSPKFQYIPPPTPPHQPSDRGYAHQYTHERTPDHPSTVDGWLPWKQLLNEPSATPPLTHDSQSECNLWRNSLDSRSLKETPYAKTKTDAREYDSGFGFGASPYIPEEDVDTRSADDKDHGLYPCLKTWLPDTPPSTPRVDNDLTKGKWSKEETRGNQDDLLSHNGGLDDDKALEHALALSVRSCPVSDIPEKRIPKRRNKLSQFDDDEIALALALSESLAVSVPPPAVDSEDTSVLKLSLAGESISTKRVISESSEHPKTWARGHADGESHHGLIEDSSEILTKTGTNSRTKLEGEQEKEEEEDESEEEEGEVREVEEGELREEEDSDESL